MYNNNRSLTLSRLAMLRSCICDATVLRSRDMYQYAVPGTQPVERGACDQVGKLVKDGAK